MFFLADGEEAFTGGVVVGFYYLAGVPEVGCLAAGAERVNLFVYGVVMFGGYRYLLTRSG